jgi:methyl-accepting chemotaxis protein
MKTQSSIPAPRNSELAKQAEALAHEAAHLKSLAFAFERWHQDMIASMAQNRHLSGNGADLISIAQQLIMVSLNAAVEAAHAGEATRGFVVIASEIKSLARRVQSLSSDIDQNLHKSSLMATATFQDIQAGGKLMMAVVSGLEAKVDRLRQGVSSP